MLPPVESFPILTSSSTMTSLLLLHLNCIILIKNNTYIILYHTIVLIVLNSPFPLLGSQDCDTYNTQIEQDSNRKLSKKSLLIDCFFNMDTFLNS